MSQERLSCIIVMCDGGILRYIYKANKKVVATSTVVPYKYKDAVINGLSFITGIGIGDVFNQIETEIKDKLL